MHEVAALAPGLILRIRYLDFYLDLSFPIYAHPAPFIFHIIIYTLRVLAFPSGVQRHLQSAFLVASSVEEVQDHTQNQDQTYDSAQKRVLREDVPYSEDGRGEGVSRRRVGSDRGATLYAHQDQQHDSADYGGYADSHDCRCYVVHGERLSYLVHESPET